MSRYWQGEWPNLSSVSIALDGPDVDMLPAEALGVLHRIIWHIAAQSVFTQFSEPKEDPRLEETRAHCVGRCTLDEWLRVKPNLEPFFDVGDDGYWRLKDFGCIRLSNEVQRSAIPTNVRATVLRRDRNRCVYCGNEEGPFHYDHLWPVSRGGSNDAHNVVLACAPCNLSKNDKTLVEWMASR